MSKVFHLGVVGKTHQSSRIARYTLNLCIDMGVEVKFKPTDENVVILVYCTDEQYLRLNAAFHKMLEGKY